MGFEDNVISKKMQSNHNVTRYSFRKIGDETPEEESRYSGREDSFLDNFEEKSTLNEPTEESSNKEPPATDSNVSAEDAEASPKATPNLTTQMKLASGVDKESIDEMLSKMDLLNSALQTMQQQFVKQQQDFERRIADTQKQSEEVGYQKGVNEYKEKSEKEINELKESYIESIDEIKRGSEEFKTALERIEKELASVAVDIAKEVVSSELSKGSEKIATSLAKALITNLKDATKIVLKLNPTDFKAVSEDMIDDERVTFKADKAITKGGVVVVSDSGNIDGTINSRFETIKKNILQSRD
ncbi:MAG: flagellar assembly protein FliH [Campylobacterales bacterium]